MKKCAFFAFFCSFFAVFASFAETKEDYEKVYTAIQNEYVDDVSLEKFVYAGIKGLNQIDKKLKIDQGYDNFSIVFADGKHKIFRKPRDKKSPSGWAESVVNIVDTAVKMSPELSLKDFELFDVINTASFSTLDEFSRYFPSLEDEDDKVKIKKYFGSHMIDDILYIKVKTFNKVTYSKIKQALLSSPSAEGLIIDLRGNRGGMLSEAVKSADLFLEEGNLIVSTKSKNDDQMQTYTAQGPDIFEDKPIMIMVDGNTASSAEMFTSALKEQGRAYVFGTTTFGKGTVQNLKIISEDKGFALTNAYFYSPQENKIHKKGIKPDFCAYDSLECTRQNRENNADDIDAATDLLKRYL